MLELGKISQQELSSNQVEDKYSGKSVLNGGGLASGKDGLNQTNGNQSSTQQRGHHASLQLDPNLKKWEAKVFY